MTRPASDSDTLLLRLGPGVKAGIVDAARRLGMSAADYVTDLFERRDGKLLRRRLVEVDAEDRRKPKRPRNGDL